MLGYTLKRLAYMLITLWLIITATFFMMTQMPGTPLQNEDKIPPAIRAQILKQYGLTDPLYVQYGRYMLNVAQGDFGKSFSYQGRPVTEIISEGFPVSLRVGGQAVVVGALIGLGLGMIAALRRGTWVDNGATVISVFGVSVPSFILAGLLSYFIGAQLQILPVALWGDDFISSTPYSILPTLALAVVVIAQISRYIRTEMVEVLDSDYMKTAKAKGLSRRVIINRHALRNALIPAVTVLGPLAVDIITGSVTVEQVFALPGVGKFFVDSIMTNDYPMIMGITIFYSILIIATIFVVDILYGIIDPRIRVAGRE